MTVAGVVLAAGGGSRFEGEVHKLRSPFRGRPLASWALEAAASAGFNQLFVVTGAVDIADLLPAATPGKQPTVLLHNDAWADGQASSLQLAVAAAAEAGHDSVVVGLADQPLVPSSAWRTVGAARGPIVAASFDGVRRPPVKLELSVWSLLPVDGDEGARTLMQLRPDLVSEVPCSGNPADIDTSEDVATWS